MSGHYDVKCHKLQGRIVPFGFPNWDGEGDYIGKALEIKCDSRICKGFGQGVVVLHYFSLLDGRLLETKRFRNPPVASTGNEVKSQ